MLADTGPTAGLPGGRWPIGSAMSTDDASPGPYMEMLQWMQQDPDPDTAQEVKRLIERVSLADQDAIALMRDMFVGRLEFGTAGIRAPMGPGPMRMNQVVVMQTAAGLGRFLSDDAYGTSASPLVVVGFDGRHKSAVFAERAARVLAGAGMTVQLMPRMLPTPVLAFAIRHLGAAAGVMITASHNPAEDNGMKVYLGGVDGGSQIVSPSDKQISAHVEQVARIPLERLPLGAYTSVAEEVIDAYIDAAAALAPARTRAASSTKVSVVYTALHGVGAHTLEQVFRHAGLGAVHAVPSQEHPDPAFPTVPFPNPEELGVLDAAIELARRQNADLVIANDPDADRLAVAVPDPGEGSGWRILTGNEIGILLGWHLARKATDAGAPVTLSTSIVSTPALSAIAEHFGAHFVPTLTGFKWISRTPQLTFGFEEALGYLVDPDKVRDKDGISAAVVFVSMVRELKEAGRSIDGQLDCIAGHIGAWTSKSLSLRVTDLADITKLMTQLRTKPPARLGELEVLSVEDLSAGLDGLPATDALRITLAGGSRVMVRPSGTEPKLKVYLDVVEPSGDRVLAQRILHGVTADAGRLLVGKR